MTLCKKKIARFPTIEDRIFHIVWKLGMKMSEYSCHRELVSTWIAEIKNTRREFREPILDYRITDRLKLFCDSLHQDSHVFQMSMEILEQYIIRKNHMKSKIKDPFLLIITIIYLSGKYTGEVSDFKTGNLIHLYDKLAHLKITNRMIKMVEIDIFGTLQNKLPLSTVIDDLKTILVYYITPLNLKFSLLRLTENLLNFYTLNKKKIFCILKDQYGQSKAGWRAFCYIYSARMYIPMGIIISAIILTNLEDIVDIDTLALKFSDACNIHQEHLYYLAEQISNTWKVKMIQDEDYGV